MEEENIPSTKRFPFGLKQNYLTEKKVAQIGKSVFQEEEPTSTSHILLQVSSTVFKSGKMTKRIYTDICLLLKSGLYLQRDVGVSHLPGTLPIGTGPNLAFLSANRQNAILFVFIGKRLYFRTISLKIEDVLTKLLCHAVVQRLCMQEICITAGQC